MRIVSEGAPEGKVLAKITKYDGKEKEPGWMDIERGATFDSVLQSVHSTLTIQKDRFKTLCHVVADISSAPCRCKVGISGKMCFIRQFDVVLMVGLTELKASIRWEDSTTVRPRDSFA